MAFRTQKISQMTPKGADLEATDLIEVSTIESGSYVTRSITGQELIDAIPVPPSGITIGTTAITSGVVGRVLFEGAGNVVQESAGLSYNDTTRVFTLLGPIGSVLQHTALTNYNGLGGFQLNLENGTERGFFKLNPQSGEVRIGATGSGYFTTFYAQGTEAMRIFSSTRNIGINTTTDASFRLDVNGTARVQDSVTVSRNQNAATTLSISNTTSGTSAQSALLLNVNTGIYKYSASTTTYKIFNANDFGHYNSALGDISILNDVGGGRIKFATGASSTAQMTLFPTGNLGIKTTTDAGFTLDVNGTARVSGNLTVTSGVFGMSSNFKINCGGDNGFRSTGSNFLLFHFAGSDNTYFGTLGMCINNGGNAPEASAQLQVNSSSRGFLPPRMTTTQKNAIASPATGLVLYDTTLNKLCVYTTAWETVTSL